MPHTGYDNITVPEATRLQNELREQITLAPLATNINTVAGADISFNKYSTTVYAGIVLLRFPELTPIGYSLVKKEVHFPYVPGYLAFREVPALMDAWDELPVKPDVLVVDGHGIAHPRRMGIAAHFGVLSRTPTIGCAKKVLCGTFSEPAAKKGNTSPLIFKNEIVGTALRTKDGVKPVFISPGNQADVESATAFMMRCIGKYRLPEPTRRAHEAVNKFRTGELNAGFTIL